MALSRSATLTFSADQVILTNTTGNYNVSTNPGGYGTPNPAFADFGHYGIIRKKNVNEVDDDVLVLNSYNPLTDTEITAERDPDGWYEGIVLDIDVWNSGDAYIGGSLITGNAVVYSGVVYVCTVNGTNRRPDLYPAEWATITDLTTIEENTTLEATIIDQATAYDADVYWSLQIALRSQRGQCGDCCIDDKLNQRLDTIQRYIVNVNTANTLGSYQDAEWNVLRLRALGAKDAA